MLHYFTLVTPGTLLEFSWAGNNGKEVVAARLEEPGLPVDPLQPHSHLDYDLTLQHRVTVGLRLAEMEKRQLLESHSQHGQ